MIQALNFIIILFAQLKAVPHGNMLHTQPKTTSSVPATETGKKIQNYIYNYSDLIGKGNFAKVYRGHNIKTNEAVAIKIISLDELKSKRLEELVFEEIRILQLMHHPNILKFHEALLSDRNCYIVTEICNQGDLEDRIKKKRTFSDAELSKVLLDIYLGLRYLKEMGVTHRDLKPANIFMHNGQAKIADFGLAKLYKQSFKDLDIGSPPYMSPEGLIHNVYSQKTDVWAFGIIIYELLHGQSPFACYKTYKQLFAAVVLPVPQHKFKKNIPPKLRQLINSLLEIHMVKRPTIHEVVKDPFIHSLVAPKQEGVNKKFSFNDDYLPQQANTNLNHVKTCPKIVIQKQVQPNTPKQLHSPTKNQIPQYICLTPNNKSQQYNPVLLDRNNPARQQKQPSSPEHNPFNKVQSKQIEEPKHQTVNYQSNFPQSPMLMKKSAFCFSSNDEAQRNINRQYNFANGCGTQHGMNPSFNSFPFIKRSSQRELSEKTTQTNESEDDRFLRDYFMQNNKNGASKHEFKKP